MFSKGRIKNYIRNLPRKLHNSPRAGNKFYTQSSTYIKVIRKRTLTVNYKSNIKYFCADNLFY